MKYIVFLFFIVFCASQPVFSEQVRAQDNSNHMRRLFVVPDNAMKAKEPEAAMQESELLQKIWDDYQAQKQEIAELRAELDAKNKNLAQQAAADESAPAPVTNPFSIGEIIRQHQVKKARGSEMKSLSVSRPSVAKPPTPEKPVIADRTHTQSLTSDKKTDTAQENPLKTAIDKYLPGLSGNPTKTAEE